MRLLSPQNQAKEWGRMYQINDENPPEYETIQIPHNRDAEEAVIGAVFIDPNIMQEIDLCQDAFYIHRLGFIWTAFERLRSRGSVIDPLTAAHELDDMGRLDEVGGPAYLTGLIANIGSSLNADSYAEIINAKWIARKRLSIANAIATKSYSGNPDISPEIDALTRSTVVKYGAAEMNHDLSALYDLAEERGKNPGDVWGIPTGLVDWDNMTGGQHAQRVSLIIGKPEAGKTTLLLQVALYAAMHGHGVALYELEMDKQNLIMRFVTLLGGPSRRQVMRGRMTDEQKTAFNGAIETLDRLPLYISDAPTMTTAQIGADIARLQATRDIELVGLDYLNLLGDADGKDNNENTVLRSRRFRQVCRERRVAGISVQSLNKTGMAADEPQLADMSGPAGVAYDADAVFTLTKSADGVDGKLIPSKVRYGENVGIIPIVRKGMRFECIARRQDQP